MFPLTRVTDVRQRLQMAAPEAAQDKRRQTHGSTESCHERWELLKEELPGAQSPARPFSQQAEGVQGTSQPHQGPNTGQGAKENQTLHEATHSEGSPHQQRVAVCKLWTNQLDDAQGVSLVPQNAPRSLQPCAPQGGGHGIHGPSPHHLGGCRQGQIGPRVRQDHTSGRQGLAQSRGPRQGRGHEHSGLPGGSLRKSHRSPSRRTQPPGQPESPNDGAESHLATGNSTRVRVDQATARLTRAQKFKAELEEKLLEVEQAVQDNLMEIAAATAELENAKRALIPSAPTTDPGSACITFSREQSAELQGFLLSCQKSMATSEQAMPLPRDSQPAAREARAVHIADIHISELNGTDIWVDVRIGMAKPDCSVPKELTRMEQEK